MEGDLSLNFKNLNESSVGEKASILVPFTTIVYATIK